MARVFITLLSLTNKPFIHSFILAKMIAKKIAKKGTKLPKIYPQKMAHFTFLVKGYLRLMIDLANVINAIIE